MAGHVHDGVIQKKFMLLQSLSRSRVTHKDGYKRAAEEDI